MSNGPTFPHRNYEFTREQAHELSEQGERDIRQRNRAPQHSSHNTQGGGQTRYEDRPDAIGETMVSGLEPEPGIRFSDDY